jgi:DNA invertase Pin-like site-specific DNA recombinase
MNEKQVTTYAGDEPEMIRCAIYTRYSSEQQRKTSTEDQIRNCKAFAHKKGWAVLEEFIRSDEELTGRTIVGRKGLADLIRLAKQRTKMFECILIDDTSRLGRYLPDVMRECDRLNFYGVFIYFVSDGLDTRDENARLVHMVKGYGDERFVREHGKKIHRGQEGRILKGYIHGGRCYGYKNVPIVDESRSGLYGQPAVKGVKREIIPAEKAVVLRIMEMRANGMSFGRIAKALKSEGIAPPGNPNRHGVSAWYSSTIKVITTNELYRGVQVWDRKQNVFNFAEGSKSRQKRPPSEWKCIQVPELRIVPDELWEKVQEVNRRGRDKYYARRQGGMNRTETSRTYLFSGTMFCGVCGGAFTVIGGKKPNVRYGCPNYRFRDTCTNKVTILRSRLEPQLILALSKNLRDPRLHTERTVEFTKQLRERIEQESRHARDAVSNNTQLKQEQTDLQLKASNLVDAIARHGLSSLLSSQLSTVEARLAELDRLLAIKPSAQTPRFSDVEIQEFLQAESTNFCDALAGDPEKARSEIQKRIAKLILTPKSTPNGIMLEVTGDVGLFRQEGVMVNNPIQRALQHYTTAGDEPLTPILLAGILLRPSPPVLNFSQRVLRALRMLRIPEPSEFLMLAYQERL